MKLAKLNDVLLEVLKQEAKLVKDNAIAVLEFDKNWELWRKIVRTEAESNLPVIAVIGPTERGRFNLLEVGIRRYFAPYSRARGLCVRMINLHERVKMRDVYIYTGTLSYQN